MDFEIIKNQLVRLMQVPQKNKFFSHVVVLAGGTAISQIVTVLAAPLLTRLYNPYEFGLTAIFSSILSILVVVAALRYEMAIPLAKDDGEAMNLLGISMVFLISTCGFLIVGIFFFGTEFFRSIQAEGLIQYRWLLPVGVLGAGVYQTLYFWATRQNLFPLISYNRILQSSGMVLIQTAFGLTKWGVAGLILGIICGQVFGITSIVRRGKLAWKKIEISKWPETANGFIRFPKYTLFASLTNTVGLQMVAILLSIYFAAEIAGFYSLTMRVLGMPLALLGQAVSQVFYPLAANNMDKTNLKDLVEKLVIVMFFISFLIFGFVFVTGPSLFALVFGETWKESGKYAQILAPWFIFWFVSSPLSSLAIVKDRQKRSMQISIFEIILRFLAIAIGAYWASAQISILLFGVAGILISLVYIWWMLRLVDINLINLGLKLRLFIGIGLMTVALSCYSSVYLDSMSLIILSICTFSGFGYWCIARWQNMHTEAT